VSNKIQDPILQSIFSIFSIFFFLFLRAYNSGTIKGMSLKIDMYSDINSNYINQSQRYHNIILRKTFFTFSSGLMSGKVQDNIIKIITDLKFVAIND